MKTYRFKIFGHNFVTKILRRDDNEILISVNGQEYKAYLEPRISKLQAKPTPKVERPVSVPAPGLKVTAKPTGSKGAGVITAPMPGLIVKINVKLGDSVKIGQPVLVLEAMKMQNAIQAIVDGTISTVAVNEGDTVIEGQELMVINQI